MVTEVMQKIKEGYWRGIAIESDKEQGGGVAIEPSRKGVYKKANT